MKSISSVCITTSPTPTGDEAGWQAYSEYLHHGLFAIRRRLGLQRFAELTDTLDRALAEQLSSGSTDGHMAWLVPLLNEYYDPMYRYQLEKKSREYRFSRPMARRCQLAKSAIAYFYCRLTLH